MGGQHLAVVQITATCLFGGTRRLTIHWVSEFFQRSPTSSFFHTFFACLNKCAQHQPCQIVEDARLKRGVQEVRTADDLFITYPLMRLTFWLHEPTSKAVFKVLGPPLLVVTLMWVRKDISDVSLRRYRIVVHAFCGVHHDVLFQVVIIGLHFQLPQQPSASTAVTRCEIPHCSHTSDQVNFHEFCGLFGSGGFCQEKERDSDYLANGIGIAITAVFMIPLIRAETRNSRHGRYGIRIQNRTVTNP